MKKCLLFVLIVAVLAMSVNADESSCPARRAAEKGHQAIEAFHQVLGPAWHQAWAAKDYDALLAAGPKFDEAFVKIAELDMVFKTIKRGDNFGKARAELATLVAQYSEACKAGDKEKVYELMPALHEAFEMTASALLPVHYPQFDGFVLTMNMILESHLPQNNMEGITGSTETLVAKLDALTEETIPEELKERQADIMADLAVIKEITATVKQCCDNSDMENYRVQIETLNAKVNEFIGKYIYL